MILRFINAIGAHFIKICNELGTFSIFTLRTASAFFTTRLKVRQVIIQMQHIGVESFTIIFLTGITSGFALALQSYIGLSRFGGEEYIGVVVAIGMVRELAPVLTGIMVTGRAGSAMAAELATMKISEQIEALKTLCVNPYQYLVIPRVVASTIIMPFLAMISMICGIFGGYVYSAQVLELNAETYLSTIKMYLEFSDILGGLIKASFFGLIVALVGSFMGYYTKGGARGVGASTTRAVVTGSILILIANYFLSTILFKAGVS